MRIVTTMEVMEEEKREEVIRYIRVGEGAETVAWGVVADKRGAD